MDEVLGKGTSSKHLLYEELKPKLEALLSGEDNLIANMANVCALLHESFGFHWTGFYIVEKNDLVLGPFQGPVACTRISFGKGVCGTAWKDRSTVVVQDVHKFPGHIACSPHSKSEIVVPGIRNEEVLFVLDIDSDQIGMFNDLDKHYLQQIVKMLIDR